MDEPILVERRISDTAAVLGIVTQINSSLCKLDEKLSMHITSETAILANEIARVMLKAFPDGDADGHRRFHEANVIKAEESAKFWRTLSVEITKFGLLGFLGWAGYALWKAFLMGPK